MPFRAEMERARTLAEDARRHYVDGEPQGKIALDYGVKASTISRRLEDARKRAVVAFSINPIFGVVGRDVPHLGRKLREKFGLDDSLVVNIGIAKGDFDSELARDDYIHLVLANCTGAKVLTGLRPKQHIALGPGRPIHQLARLVARSAPSVRDLTVTSLCGRLWAHSWDLGGFKFARPMDADDAAFIFASAFEEDGVQFNTVVHRLFAGSPEEATSFMKGYCPFRPDGSWAGEPPTRSVVGVGVVDPRSGHRIGDLYREKSTKIFAPYLLEAGEELKETIREVERRELPHFGDVMNRYFPVLPLPDELRSRNLDKLADDYQWLETKLAAFNDRVVAAGWSHLRQSKAVTAVAGGAFKLNSIFSLCIVGFLTPQNRIITELNTDSETAESLLKAFKAFESAPLAIREWYTRLAARVLKFQTTLRIAAPGASIVTPIERRKGGRAGSGGPKKSRSTKLAR